MNTQQLLSIYPQATIAPLPSMAKNMVCVAIDAGKYICIDTTNLSDRELSLLELLTQTRPSTTTDDAWSEFLTGRNTAIPHTTAQNLQLLQFRVRFTEQHANRAQWLSAIADTFEHVLHHAFITANTGYLLLTKPLTDTPADLASLLALIDNDFYTNTHLFIGSTHTDSQDLPAAFSLEQQLFSQNQQDTIVTLSGSLLPFLVGQHQPELQALRNSLCLDPDHKQLISALYHTQGNVRQAASKLFLHRNTLLYRIEKFERCSGLNLKKMDDLVYCYLLTLGQ
ncbi:PucR family transcriptional regulator [Lactiplantibacillus paraplantarum]|uniref:PucR family transcriptional regulator n=1 Tax=Lactiplantibacillus paraplantarum TaxID=60520 RepID=UPI0023AA6A44|nr:helix-turn-helix domain-containing protein [Lactiplantibacillus paraplantarum]WEE35981.1 helix-turn-helix domain-containing protein [Lactiplantibacillus paraplantarum]